MPVRRTYEGDLRPDRTTWLDEILAFAAEEEPDSYDKILATLNVEPVSRIIDQVQNKRRYFEQLRDCVHAYQLLNFGHKLEEEGWAERAAPSMIAAEIRAVKGKGDIESAEAIANSSSMKVIVLFNSIRRLHAMQDGESVWILLRTYLESGLRASTVGYFPKVYDSQELALELNRFLYLGSAILKEEANKHHIDKEQSTLLHAPSFTTVLDWAFRNQLLGRTPDEGEEVKEEVVDVWKKLNAATHAQPIESRRFHPLLEGEDEEEFVNLAVKCTDFLVLVKSKGEMNYRGLPLDKADALRRLCHKAGLTRSESTLQTYFRK